MIESYDGNNSTASFGQCRMAKHDFMTLMIANLSSF